MAVTPDEAWMRPGHPLEGHPEYAHHWAPFLADVDATRAARLPGKRRDFRAVQDRDRLADIVSELQTLLWMHRRGQVGS